MAWPNLPPPPLDPQPPTQRAIHNTARSPRVPPSPLSPCPTVTPFPHSRPPSLHCATPGTYQAKASLPKP